MGFLFNILLYSRLCWSNYNSLTAVSFPIFSKITSHLFSSIHPLLSSCPIVVYLWAGCCVLLSSHAYELRTLCWRRTRAEKPLTKMMRWKRGNSCQRIKVGSSWTNITVVKMSELSTKWPRKYLLNVAP